MSKLLRSKTLHVIPGLTRNLIDEKIASAASLAGAVFLLQKARVMLILL